MGITPDQLPQILWLNFTGRVEGLWGGKKSKKAKRKSPFCTLKHKVMVVELKELWFSFSFRTNSVSLSWLWNCGMSISVSNFSPSPFILCKKGSAAGGFLKLEHLQFLCSLSGSPFISAGDLYTYSCNAPWIFDLLTKDTFKKIPLI